MPNVPAELTRYAAAGRDAVGLVASVVEIVRGLRDPVARAARLRRRAARLLRRAHTAIARANRAKASELRGRATELWREAEGLDPTPATR